MWGVRIVILSKMIFYFGCYFHSRYDYVDSGWEKRRAFLVFK